MAPHDDPRDLPAPDFDLLRSEPRVSIDTPSKIELLLRHFENHEYKEQKTLEEYRDAIGRVKNPMAKFLLDLIGQDEIKHHELVNAMFATLEKSIFWRHPPAALDVFEDVGTDKEELLALVAKFSRVEREGIKEYEALVGDTKGYYEGLFSLLLRMLIKDSEKHLMLLEFLEKYIKAARA